MSYTPKTFFTTVTATAQNYTVPADTIAIINNIAVQNNTAGALTLSFGIMASAGTMDNTNKIVSQSIPAGGFIEITGAIVAETGSVLQLIASGAGLACRVSGQVVT